MQDSDSPDGRGWQGRNGSPGGDNDVTATVIGDADEESCGPAKDAAGVLADALRAMRNAESDLGKLVAVRDAATDLTRLGADNAISDLEDIARDVGNLTPIEIGAALRNSAPSRSRKRPPTIAQSSTYSGRNSSRQLKSSASPGSS
jgi:hypothetical protein